jgi:hypothetical protein
VSARCPLALVPLLALLGAGATLSGCSPALTGLAQGVAMSLGQAAGQSGSGSAPAAGMPSGHQLAAADDAHVCQLALRDGAWDTKARYAPWVGEAKQRDLSVDDCRRARIADAFDGQVCSRIAADTAPVMPADEAALWQAEADRRGLTPQSCPTAG